MKKQNLDRREFLKAAGLGAAAFAWAPFHFPWSHSTPGSSHPLRKGRLIAADKKLNIAAIGCGGKGSSDIAGVASENIVALCDVDFNRARSTFANYPNVPKFKDYRQMLLEMDDKIDAVTVSTPDHMHFPAALMAMEMGKHVYVQKPLTHTIWEARTLTETARKHGVITQMGNQGHAGEGIRLVREWIQAGAIGPVHEVHIWSNRPVWRQGGLVRPAQIDDVPQTLDWNAWLGVAPERPYNKAYLPFGWRGWWDFGCGALGDMGCHLMDASFWALDLMYPTSVEAVSEGNTAEGCPKSSVITYQFPARGKRPPLTLKWYDGGRTPERPKELEASREMPSSGQLILGEKGAIMDQSDYCTSPRLIPESAMQAFTRPAKTIPRVPKSNPHMEWVNACKGGPRPGSNFDYAGPFSETVLLGNLAIRLGTKIQWDGDKMRCTNLPDAAPLIRKNYRVF